MAAQKKSPIAQERDEEERAAWREEAAGIAPELFVWVDECGTHTSMTRTRARAPRGERAYGKVPRNRGPNTTLIASMTLEGAMGASMAIEGALPTRRSSRPTWSTSWRPPSIGDRSW